MSPLPVPGLSSPGRCGPRSWGMAGAWVGCWETLHLGSAAGGRARVGVGQEGCGEGAGSPVCLHCCPILLSGRPGRGCVLWPLRAPAPEVAASQMLHGSTSASVAFCPRHTVPGPWEEGPVLGWRGGACPQMEPQLMCRVCGAACPRGVCWAQGQGRRPFHCSSEVFEELVFCF